MRRIPSLDVFSNCKDDQRTLLFCSFPKTLEGGGNRHHWQLQWVSLGCPSSLPRDVYRSVSSPLIFGISSPWSWCLTWSVHGKIGVCLYPVTAAALVSELCGSLTASGDLIYISVSGSLSLHLSEVEGCHLRGRGAADLERTRRSQGTAGWWGEGKEG